MFVFVCVCVWVCSLAENCRLQNLPQLSLINVRDLKLRTDKTKAVQLVLLSSCSQVRANTNYKRLNGVDGDNDVSETMTNGLRWITQQRCKLSQLVDKEQFLLRCEKRCAWRNNGSRIHTIRSLSWTNVLFCSLISVHQYAPIMSVEKSIGSLLIPGSQVDAHIIWICLRRTVLKIRLGTVFHNALALVMVHLSPKEKEGEACMSNICKY